MKEYRYTLVDVFASEIFGGNQLAVFAEADGLSDERMQQVARELNLSETTFVFPPADAESDYRVRIFTPAMELPMAGHPTIGTAYVLAKNRDNQPRRFNFEEGVGVIPVQIDYEKNEPAEIWMEQPPPKFLAEFSDRALVAEALSLQENRIRNDLPVQGVSCGVPFLFVPIADLAGMREMKLRQDIWERVFKDSPAQHIFAFTTETESREATVHSRMFAPAMGISEDPATGAASGPLGCYLLRYGVVKPKKADRILNEQGVEMGRPSLIHIAIEGDGDFSKVRIGGRTVPVGEGVLRLER